MGIPYLSAEWADEITRAANADPEFLAALRGRAASMTTTVIGAPSGGEVVYVMASTGRAFHVRLGAPDEPTDAEFRTPYEIAVGLANGSLTAPRAMMTGKVRTSGDLREVMALAPAMKRLAGLGEEIGVAY
jgi:putative sterol carrier protein